MDFAGIAGVVFVGVPCHRSVYLSQSLWGRGGAIAKIVFRSLGSHPNLARWVL